MNIKNICMFLVSINGKNVLIYSWNNPVMAKEGETTRARARAAGVGPGVLLEGIQ